MFGMYTQRAIHTLELAAQEAQSLNRHSIGIECLVLALLRISEDEGAIGPRLLSRLGLTEEAFRAQLQNFRGYPPPDPPGYTGGREVRFTARMNYVLERSLQLALDIGCGYVGTEHLLLGMLYERCGTGLGPADRYLDELGITYEATRDLVLEEGAEEPGESSGPLLPLMATPAVKKTQGATHIDEFARQRAKYDETYKGQVGTHHYLLALMQEGVISPAHGGPEGGGLAARALRSFGLSYAVLEARINELRGSPLDGFSAAGSDVPGPTPPPGPRPEVVENPPEGSISEEERQRLRELNERLRRMYEQDEEEER